MSELSNEERAGYASQALLEYSRRKEGRDSYDPVEDMAADLICDLLHLVGKETGADPTKKMNMAMENFLAEHATAEVLELRKRRDDLLAANNRLVEELRAMWAARDDVVATLHAEVFALREVLEWGTGGPVAPDYEDFCERARKALEETAGNAEAYESYGFYLAAVAIALEETAATAEAYEQRVREDERRRMYAAVDALRAEVAEHVEIADDEDVALVAVEVLRRARGLQRCVRCDRWGTNLHHTGDDSGLCTDCLADLESEDSNG